MSARESTAVAFARLCEAIEVPDAPKDPRFATTPARLQNREAADTLVRTWIARHDLADVEARFSAVGVTGTAVRSVDDIIADELIRSRQSLLRVRSQSGQDFLAAAPVPRFSRTPARHPVGAPGLGEHTDIVRASCAGIAAQPWRAVRDEVKGEPSGALNGIRVLDLSQWLAGPAAAAILADFGADARSTADRIAEFHRVENTYLSTFQTLGGLGLLLGTVGLAAVLLRNVLERRRELALLGAVGYGLPRLFVIVVTESALLLISGLAA